MGYIITYYTFQRGKYGFNVKKNRTNVFDILITLEQCEDKMCRKGWGKISAHIHKEQRNPTLMSFADADIDDKNIISLNCFVNLIVKSVILNFFKIEIERRKYYQTKALSENHHSRERDWRCGDIFIE